ncbi:MAG TPA: NRDE family protein [Pyrinomonadaceae bacterium]|jgi:uncharacterized protein with NRDE domain
MCVIFFAYKYHPEYPLILLANRDEYFSRATERAKNWDDFPLIMAGRDLVGGGTWLGVTEQGRFAAVTNYREPFAVKSARTRGALVADFLKSDESAETYLKNIWKIKNEFSGFNLLLGEINNQKSEIFYFSNRSNEITRLEKGLYGLSNHLLDTPWQKVIKGKAVLAEILKDEKFFKESFFELLSDESLADDEKLPDTGIGYEKEKLLSAIFIKTPIYGTRCSTVLTFDKDNRIHFEERVFV